MPLSHSARQTVMLTEMNIPLMLSSKKLLTSYAKTHIYARIIIKR